MPEARVFPAVDAVAFDFDGVILDSAGIKTQAFERLFESEGPQAQARILEHHKANAGISRFVKFRWAYREVLRRPLPESEERALGERFNSLVEEAVAAAAWIPGAREFLEAHHATVPLYVVSGTPQEELERIVRRRGLTGTFRRTLGSPASKCELLTRIAQELRVQLRRVVMVGDAANDLAGARAAGTSFIGVCPASSPNPFPSDVRVLPDLRPLADALRAIHGD
jgi:HAD superfamily hydrolase (TIGR01549 family)